MPQHFDPQLAISPGSVIEYNYAPNVEQTKSALRAVQWNIERAYKLDEIIQLLRSLDPDIIVVQEIDVLCQRSGFRDSAMEICQKLQMNGVFVVEFLEIKSSRRQKSTQGGGWHGNGIISRYPIRNIRPIVHSHQPIDWNKDGWKYREPRIGKRVFLSAEVEFENVPIVIYTIHLEVFCGIFDRIRQFANVLADVHKLIDERHADHFLIFGDLNTMAHGLARMFRKYCRDDMRWRSIGKSEAQYWHHNIFECFACPNMRLAKFCPRYLSQSDLAVLWNPWLFDAHPQTTTLQFYKGIAFKGKLDWTLLRGFAITHSGTANDDYTCSDHKLLWADLCVLKGESAAEDAFVLHQEYIQHCRRLKKKHAHFPMWILLAAVTMLLIFVVSIKMIGPPLNSG